ncbi:MAG: hypothetical protein HW390_2288 [Candidatus Brocadiaceae bacterium]|nr:hypothetical protein [Candidatus Brocadiaceae bacterium]
MQKLLLTFLLLDLQKKHNSYIAHPLSDLGHSTFSIYLLQASYMPRIPSMPQGLKGRWAMPTLLLFVRKTQGVEALVEIVGDGCGDGDGFVGVGVFEGYLVCVEHLPLDVL